MLYGGNGLQAASPPGTYSAAVDLENITGGPDETSLQALGGRIGFWVPKWGVMGGVSAYFNGRYSSAAPDQFDLWDLDLSYRKGNWDLRFEYANTYQQATSYIGNNIRRQGFYVQAAYRPYHLAHCILNRLEVAARYSRVWFHGIDPNLLDPTAFATPVDVPVNREQWTLGVNYYFYPSMALRLAYEINHELNDVNLHDNVFLAQFVWAF
jgi:predicted porin